MFQHMIQDYMIILTEGELMQLDDQDIMQPIAFYSRQMLAAERNYDIYDKELLVIVSCFRHWRHFLQGARFTTSVLTECQSSLDDLKSYFAASQIMSHPNEYKAYVLECDASGRPDYFVPTEPKYKYSANLYQPQTNGMVERMHAMLKHSFTTLTLDQPSRWDEYLKQAVFALRTRTLAVTKSFYSMAYISEG